MRGSRLSIFFVCCLLVVLGVVPAHSREPVRILASTFPVFLMTRNVTEGVDNVRVDIMLPPGMGCPHDYALTPKDMRKLAGADIFVVNGLGLEDFLGEPLKKANPALRLVDASAGVSAAGKVLAEKDDEEGEHDDHDEHAHDAHHHGGANPHIFASPRMAALMVTSIAEQLAALDPAGAKAYAANAGGYAARLNALADDLSRLGSRAKNRHIAAPVEVFDYFARDAGLDVAVTFHAHAGEEGSAAEMLATVKRAKDARVALLVAEPHYAKLGGRLARESGVPLVVVHPMDIGPSDVEPQAVPLDFYEQGMRRNLDALGGMLGVTP